jgi:hypothetical protein
LHTENWASRGDREVIERIKALLVKQWWRAVPAAQILDEVKSVLPHFWEHYRKRAKRNKTYLLQSAKESDTFKTNLGKFLELVETITQKKEKDIISKPRRAKQLEKASELEYLQEFIKIEASQQLADENEEEQT